MRIVTERRSVQDLEGAPRELPEHFQLLLDDRNFDVEHVLRWLPGKRLTAVVQPGLVLKLFIGDRSAERLAREESGLRAFAKAGLPSPAVVERSVSWLVFERLPNAQHATADKIGALADALAQLHEAGFAHGDLHLGNFLLSNDELYLIDGDSVVERPVALDAGLSELSILLVQFPVTQDGLEHAALDAYLARRGIQEGSMRTFRDKVEIARRKRVEHYLAKSRRTCTEFEVEHTKAGRLVSRRDALDVGRWLSDHFESLFADNENLLKAGRSATVLRATYQGRRVVVKRYNLKGFLHRLRRVFKKRGRCAWESALSFEFLGIPTARALALLETGWRWWPGPAYLLTEDLGDRDLAMLTEDDTIAPELVEQIVTLIQSLRRAGFVHNDFKSTNLLLHEQRLHLIDMDGAQMSGSVGRVDEERMVENWPEGSRVRQTVRRAIEQAVSI